MDRVHKLIVSFTTDTILATQVLACISQLPCHIPLSLNDVGHQVYYQSDSCLAILTTLLSVCYLLIDKIMQASVMLPLNDTVAVHI